jgi:hypothetical protein
MRAPEAAAGLVAQQAVGRHLEAVEGDLVLLHAAIAQHLDLAAAHARGGERIGLGAARLGREEHRQPVVARGLGIGTGEQRHHVAARAVRRPGLGAVDAPAAARQARRARAQAGEVRSGVGLREDRAGQDLAARDAGQPSLLLRLGAGAGDQLAGDLRARAERADGQEAARELLGDHAHRELAHAEAAPALVDGDAEGAELGHAGDDVVRDQAVLEVPAMRVGAHLLAGEAAEGLAHHVERVVAQGLVGKLAFANHRRERRAPAGGIAMGDEALHRRVALELRQRGRGAEVRGTGELELAHRDAADDLREVLSHADQGDVALHLAEAAAGGEPVVPAGELGDRLYVRRRPREAVERALVSSPMTPSTVVRAASR